ncbi:MAG TPA: hypothetical protein VFZ89_04770 [Solirubrobacteraceae bacterium]
MRRALALLLLAFPASAGAAYDPKVTLSVPAAGGPGSPAAVSATITQAMGEDSHRTIEARLPGTFGFNAGFVRTDAPIGRISAQSVFGPASGELFLTEDYRVVGKVTGLGGLVTVPFEGVLEVLSGQEIVLRFENLPDVAATRLAVEMDGGARTPLALPATCGTHVIEVRLVGRAGDEHRTKHPVAVGGCRAALPVVTAPRVSGRVLRWKTTGARTEVTLRRRVGGVWREVSKRTTARTRLRIPAVRRGRHAFALVPIAADGTRGLAHMLWL